MKNGNIIWDGHEGFNRIRPAVDLCGYWMFVAGFLLGVVMCVMIYVGVNSL